MKKTNSEALTTGKPFRRVALTTCRLTRGLVTAIRIFAAHRHRLNQIPFHSDVCFRLFAVPFALRQPFVFGCCSCCQRLARHPMRRNDASIFDAIFLRGEGFSRYAVTYFPLSELWTIQNPQPRRLTFRTSIR